MENLYKVVFIFGTPRSGTTILDLILGSVEEGFACGEAGYIFTDISNLDKVFQNKRNIHTDKELWKQVKKAGQENMFNVIYQKTGARLISISQADRLEWMEEVSHAVKNQGIEVFHLFLYKTALELAWSWWKRGVDLKKRNKKQKLEKGKKIISNLKERWIGRCKKYLEFADNPFILAYSDLAKRTKVTVKKVFEYMNHPFDSKALQYWETEHNQLYGNSRVMRQVRDYWAGQEHPGIFYASKPEKIPEFLKEGIENNSKIMSWNKHMKQLEVEI